jgi:hypothetical protein
MNIGKDDPSRYPPNTMRNRKQKTKIPPFIHLFFRPIRRENISEYENIPLTAKMIKGAVKTT